MLKAAFKKTRAGIMVLVEGLAQKDVGQKEGSGHSPELEECLDNTLGKIVGIWGVPCRARSQI